MRPPGVAWPATGNTLIALVLWGMLVLFFIWRRDLVANMIGHWFVDFIGNVLPRLLPA